MQNYTTNAAGWRDQVPAWVIEIIRMRSVFKNYSVFIALSKKEGS